MSGRRDRRIPRPSDSARLSLCVEPINFRVAPDESETSWDRFLRPLRERGLVEENRWGERLERIASDRAGGIEATLALNYPETPHQACVFHKVKNILGDLNDKTRKGLMPSEAGRILKARTRRDGRGVTFASWRAFKEPPPPTPLARNLTQAIK